MASNSIFDTFSSYSPSLLRGKSPVVAFPSLLLHQCGVQKASFGGCNVHKRSVWCVCCSLHVCLWQFSSCERVTVHACLYVGLMCCIWTTTPLLLHFLKCNLTVYSISIDQFTSLFCFVTNWFKCLCWFKCNKASYECLMLCLNGLLRYHGKVRMKPRSGYSMHKSVFRCKLHL